MTLEFLPEGIASDKDGHAIQKEIASASDSC